MTRTRAGVVVLALAAAVLAFAGPQAALAAPLPGDGFAVLHTNAYDQAHKGLIGDKPGDTDRSRHITYWPGGIKVVVYKSKHYASNYRYAKIAVAQMRRAGVPISMGASLGVNSATIPSGPNGSQYGLVTIIDQQGGRSGGCNQHARKGYVFDGITAPFRSDYHGYEVIAVSHIVMCSATYAGNQSAGAARTTVLHEMGHAIGLDHFSTKFRGKYQVMGEYVPSPPVSYQAGDINGMKYLEGQAASLERLLTPRGQIESITPTTYEGKPAFHLIAWASNNTFDEGFLAALKVDGKFVNPHNGIFKHVTRPDITGSKTQNETPGIDATIPLPNSAPTHQVCLDITSTGLDDTGNWPLQQVGCKTYTVTAATSSAPASSAASTAAAAPPSAAAAAHHSSSSAGTLIGVLAAVVVIAAVGVALWVRRRRGPRGPGGPGGPGGFPGPGGPGGPGGPWPPGPPPQGWQGGPPPQGWQGGPPPQGWQGGPPPQGWQGGWSPPHGLGAPGPQPSG